MLIIVPDDEQFGQWLTGFWESDGSVYLSAGYPKVGFYQKERDVLDYISLQLGGRYVPHLSTNGVIHQLQVQASSCIPLLKLFSEHVVGDYYLKRLNVVLNVVGLSSTVLHLPTIDWLAGFWDGDGSSDSTPGLTASQRTRDMLDAIEVRFGGNVRRGVDGMYHWELYGGGVYELMQEVAARSHCPTKRECLLSNFVGPRRQERIEYMVRYRREHREEIRLYLEDYREKHRSDIKETNKKCYEERKCIKEWMEEHPEVVQRLTEKLHEDS